MALIDDMYVPAINWRQGEYQALLRLTDLAKGRILPLITIPKIEYDFDDGMPKHTVQEHVEKFPTRYKQKWKSRPAWIDVHQSLHAGTMTGGTSVCEFVFDELRKFGAKAIPVAAIDYAPGVLAVVAGVVATDKLGVCVRARLDHIMLNEIVSMLVLKMLDVLRLAGDEVVHANHLMPLRKQKVGQVRPKKARGAGNKNLHGVFSFRCSVFSEAAWPLYN